MTIAQDDPAELRALRKQLLLARSRLSRLRLQRETILLRTWAVRGRQVVETSLLLWSVRKAWSLFQGIRQARAAALTTRRRAQRQGNPPWVSVQPAGGGVGNRLAIGLAVSAITTLARLVRGWRHAPHARDAAPEN